MADYVLYYIKFLSPLLVLAVCLCVVTFCCKICRTDVIAIDIDIDTDTDLSNNDQIYVIPIDERDEPDYDEEPDYTPPPYYLVCPPSYTESSMKEMETSYGSVEMPPPPYAPFLDVMSVTPSYQQQ